MTEYNLDVQMLFLRMMMTHPELYLRVANIFNPENFVKPLRPVADLIKTHCDEYMVLPETTQVKAITGIELELIPELTSGHFDWFFAEFEHFIRKEELTRAIMKAADLLEEGKDFDPVEKLIKDAVQISLQKDMGTDYFFDPRGRLLALKSNNGQNSTGWPSMDRKLYGGFNRGELQIFAGSSGAGKSLFLQNLGVNWVQAGLSGAYITLELNEGLTGMRIDSMMTGTSTREVFKDIDNVELKVKILAKSSGKFQLKYLPAQSTINDVRSYCKELQIKTGNKLDFLCVDYLDLLMPVSVKVSAENLFVKDKYVAEELRNLAKELNVLMVTASQLNRGAVEEIEFDHSHIAGGISKINTADNVFGIFTSRSMREKGQYQIQLMKTRSSSGIGQKIELDFNVETLRITDPDVDGDGSNTSGRPPTPTPNEIMAKLKPTPYTDVSQLGSEEESSEPVKHIVADVQGSKLRGMLANLKR